MTRYSSLSYSFKNIQYSLEKTCETKVEALCGLLPIVFFYLEAIVLFTQT